MQRIGSSIRLTPILDGRRIVTVLRFLRARHLTIYVVYCRMPKKER